MAAELGSDIIKDKPMTSTATKLEKLRQTSEATPDELFKKMADGDKAQNKRLSRKFSGPTLDGLKGPMRVTKVRFLICVLGLISLAMSQMSRMIFNQSITQMVDPRMSSHEGDSSGDKSALDGSCPWPVEEFAVNSTTLTSETTTMMTSQGELMSDLPDFQEAMLNPDLVDQQVSPRGGGEGLTTTSSANKLRSHNGTDHSHLADDEIQVDRFMWTMQQQNTLLGGFYYSYSFLMVLGGRMAEIYGAKYVILLSVAGSALINLATPWMARTNFTLLVISRVLMGAIQSGVFPGVYALIAKWLNMSETSIFAPLIKMSLRLGMVLGSMMPGLVAGWPNVFYVTGTLSVLWSISWILIATSDPADNKWVSEGELWHIVRKKKNKGHLEADSNKSPVSAKSMPWLKILTAPSVICLIVVKLTFNFAIDFLAIELPSYLKYVQHASYQHISLITTLMFIIQVSLIFFVGWLAKAMVQRKPLGISKTGIRKLFQGVASLGLAGSFFLLTLNNCNLFYVAILLMIGSLLSMFTAGGETMLPYDLSGEYPATIMAIANSIANFSAIAMTNLAGFILGDQGGSYERWNILIYFIVGVNLFGGLVFMLFVRAEPIDFGPDASDVELAVRGDGAKDETKI